MFLSKKCSLKIFWLRFKNLIIQIKRRKFNIEFSPFYFIHQKSINSPQDYLNLLFGCCKVEN